MSMGEHHKNPDEDPELLKYDIRCLREELQRVRDENRLLRQMLDDGHVHR